MIRNCRRPAMYFPLFSAPALSEAGEGRTGRAFLIKRSFGSVVALGVGSRLNDSSFTESKRS